MLRHKDETMHCNDSSSESAWMKLSIWRMWICLFCTLSPSTSWRQWPPPFPESQAVLTFSSLARRREGERCLLGHWGEICVRETLPSSWKPRLLLYRAKLKLDQPPIQEFLKKKQFVTASHKVVVELCTGRKSCKKGTTCTWCLAIALGAWQLQLYLHFVPVTKEGRENVLTRGDVFSKSTAGPTIVIIIIPG